MSPLNSKSTLAALAEAAACAPSADNHHIFRLGVSKDGQDLELLETNDLATAAPDRRVLALLSVGCAIQNLQLRARALGLSLEPRKPAGEPGSGRLLASLSCHQAEVFRDPLDAFLSQRLSNRRWLFSGPRLDPSDLEKLADPIPSLPSTRVTCLDRSMERISVVRLIAKAESQRFKVEQLHREMFETVRFDVGWKANCTEGVPPGSLCLSAVERPLFEIIKKWPVQKVMNLFLAHKVIAWRAAALPCWLAPHICVVSAEGTVAQGAIDAGRMLQLLWLRATQAGLSVQVFAAAGLYAVDNTQPVPSHVQQELALGWKALGFPGNPYMVVRIGRSSAPPYRAERKPARSMLI